MLLLSQELTTDGSMFPTAVTKAGSDQVLAGRRAEVP